VNEATHIKPLTAMRFYAAMWVVLFHYWPKLAVSFTPAFVDRGYLGVELFFVLSGFILCHVYLPAADRGEFKYGGFLWARIARVYPLHLVTLVGPRNRASVLLNWAWNYLTWDRGPRIITSTVPPHDR